MLDKDESGMVEFPEFARVMAKRAEVEAIKKKTQEFRDALKVFLQKNTVDLTKKMHVGFRLQRGWEGECG